MPCSIAYSSIPFKQAGRNSPLIVQRWVFKVSLRISLELATTLTWLVRMRRCVFVCNCVVCLLAMWGAGIVCVYRIFSSVQEHIGLFVGAENSQRYWYKNEVRNWMVLSW